MDMYRIHGMLEDVSEAASTELAKGTDSVNTKEFGEVVDMIKDLSEAEKNKMEACYYKTLINAMEESEYGEDYDEYGPMERRGYSRGSRGGNRGRSNYSSRRNYPMDEGMMYNQRYDEYMNGRMGYSNGAYGGGSRGMSSNSSNNSSRYGYSYDKYMSNRRNYSKTDPEDKQERIKMMEEYSTDLIGSISKVMEDVSPEEKQMLKNNLNKVMSAM